MKSFEELRKRFDSIPELPVSEEMLCARLEGSLDGFEEMEVDMAIIQDDNFHDLVSEMEDITGNQLVDLDNWITNNDLDQLPQLPDVPDTPIELTWNTPNEALFSIDSNMFSPENPVLSETVCSFDDNILTDANLEDFFDDDEKKSLSHDIFEDEPSSHNTDDIDSDVIDPFDNI